MCVKNSEEENKEHDLRQRICKKSKRNRLKRRKWSRVECDE